MKFEDINTGYTKILKNIIENGELKGKRREIIFLNFTLEDMDKNILFFPFAQRNWPWILRETSDRIFNITNPGTSFKYSKNWENRIEDSGLYSYHYANRLNGQMKELLSKKIHSRDKIVQVWQKDDVHMKGRQPCTIIFQPIMEADNKLSLVVYMRNNDMINIFPSDVFIHSTYFKYWATYYGHDYKNLYWIAGVAYYQKKRDVLQFPQRLITEWNDDYSKVNSTKWNKSLIEELTLKENIEATFNDETKNDYYFIDAVNLFKIPYVREWYMTMLLAKAKQQGDKDVFQDIVRRHWETEFRLIKNSITGPK